MAVLKNDWQEEEEEEVSFQPASGQDLEEMIHAKPFQDYVMKDTELQVTQGSSHCYCVQTLLNYCLFVFESHLKSLKGHKHTQPWCRSKRWHTVLLKRWVCGKKQRAVKENWRWINNAAHCSSFSGLCSAHIVQWHIHLQHNSVQSYIIAESWHCDSC